MTHTTLLDVAFGVGVLVQVTKLMDMGLRAHQKKRLQDRLETLALILSDIKPMSIAERVRMSDDRAFVAMYIGLAVIILELWLFDHDVQDWQLLVKSAAYIGIFSALTCSNAFNVNSLRAKQEDWMFNHGLLPFLGRWIIFTACGAAVSIALIYLSCQAYYNYVEPFGYVGSAWGALGDCDTAQDLAINISVMSPSVMVGFYCFGGSWLGATIILFHMQVFILSCLVRAASAIVWRIVEYNSGAWAALTALGTAAIGGLDWYLHYKP